VAKALLWKVHPQAALPQPNSNLHSLSMPPHPGPQGPLSRIHQPHKKERKGFTRPWLPPAAPAAPPRTPRGSGIREAPAAPCAPAPPAAAGAGAGSVFLGLWLWGDVKLRAGVVPPAGQACGTRGAAAAAATAATAAAAATAGDEHAVQISTVANGTFISPPTPNPTKLHGKQFQQHACRYSCKHSSASSTAPGCTTTSITIYVN
jgi:hypothetical protein